MASAPPIDNGEANKQIASPGDGFGTVVFRGGPDSGTDTTSNDTVTVRYSYEEGRQRLPCDRHCHGRPELVRETSRELADAHSPLAFAGRLDDRPLPRLSGTAMALDGSDTVFSDDIVNEEVATADIASAAVTTSQLRNFSVTNANLAADSVRTGRVANRSLTAADLAGDDFATNSITGADIDESALRAAAALGITALAASGDLGLQGCQEERIGAEWPASSQYVR